MGFKRGMPVRQSLQLGTWERVVNDTHFRIGELCVYHSGFGFDLGYFVGESGLLNYEKHVVLLLVTGKSFTRDGYHTKIQRVLDYDEHIGEMVERYSYRSDTWYQRSVVPSFEETVARLGGVQCVIDENSLKLRW